MQRSLTSLTLLLTLALHANPSAAFGFGKVSGSATLGQTLDFIVPLRLDASESLEPSCVKAEVSSGDRTFPPSLVRVRLDLAEAGSSERRLHVLSSVAIEEPVVSIAVQVGCPPSLSRSFVVFADPPLRSATFDAAPAEQAANNGAGSTLSTVLGAVPPAPAGVAQGSRKAPSRARAPKPASAASSSDLPSRAAVAAAAGSIVASPRGRRAAKAAKPPSGSVLRLDPVESESLVQPDLQMATTLGHAPDLSASGVAPRYVDPDVEQRLREQARLKAMEAALQKIRSDNQATQKALGDMQQRVLDAQAGRYANPLVYALAVLCMLLAAAAGAFWWLRQRDRQNVWWAEQAEENLAFAPAAPVPVAKAEDSAPMPPSLPHLTTLPLADRPPPAPFDSTRTMVVGPPSGYTAAPPPSVAVARDSERGEFDSRRPMSAEELIDLEQQAEFFVVLGQDDAAIDLLMGHVRSTGGVSPLPYLKLLEIYRRREEREPYDRIRERFNRRFNAYAPEWEVDPESGLSLEGYPEVLARLQHAWDSPTQATRLLDASLFRRDAGPTFDVPAYRELLFLYSTARDLAEHETPNGAVDLLLPLGEDEAAAAPVMAAVEATPAAPAPAPEVVDPHFSLDFDLSSDPPPQLSLEEREFKNSGR